MPSILPIIKGPMTVQEWMEQHPPLTNAPDWRNCKGLDMKCSFMGEALTHVAAFAKGITAKRFWSGACDFWYRFPKEPVKWRAYHAGYDEAAAAFDHAQRIAPNPSPESMMTEGERKVFDDLASAWNHYLKLEVQHPSDQFEFQQAIHDCQKMIALRVARRVCPDEFKTVPHE